MLKYKISSITKTAGDIKIIRMIPIAESLKFRSGQFVIMHFLDGQGNSIDKRPYSIASEPNSPYLEFCIKMVGGRFTSKLDLLGEGAVVGIEGPMGVMGYEGEKCVFICGGTGIAPIMSMVRDLAQKRKNGSFFDFNSAKNRETLIYYDELLQLEKKNPSLHIIVSLTREEPKGWAGRCGRIGGVLLHEYVANPEEYSWYVCGPLEMSSAIRECISAMGADPKRVHVEGWG